MHKQYSLNEVWRQRCRETLYGVLSGAIPVPDPASSWLADYTLASEAMPEAALSLSVHDGFKSPGVELIYRTFCSNRLSVSETAETTVAILNCSSAGDAVRIAASNQSGTVALEISGVTLNTLMFLVPEETAEEVRIVQLCPGETANVEFARAASRFGLAFYPVWTAEMLFAEAERLREGKHFQASLREYDRVLLLNDQYYQAWRGKAYALRELNRRQEGLQCAIRSVEINPGYATGWRSRGAILRDMGRDEEGLECYERGLAIDPADETLRQNRINALKALGRPLT